MPTGQGHISYVHISDKPDANYEKKKWNDVLLKWRLDEWQPLSLGKCQWNLIGDKGHRPQSQVDI